MHALVTVVAVIAVALTVVAVIAVALVTVVAVIAVALVTVVAVIAVALAVALHRAGHLAERVGRARSRAKESTLGAGKRSI